MASIAHIKTEKPTVSEFIAAVRPPMPGLTEREVIAACKARGVTLKDGRFQRRDDMADAFFGVVQGREVAA
jgi:hypothetical protein